MNCPHCNTDISNNASRCPHCTGEIVKGDPSFKLWMAVAGCATVGFLIGIFTSTFVDALYGAALGALISPIFWVWSRFFSPQKK